MEIASCCPPSLSFFAAVDFALFQLWRAFPPQRSVEGEMEAARIELASKTVGLSITTSVSPVLFLDADLCRGRLVGHPVRLF